MTKSGDVDGCFVDGCLKVEAPVGKSERAAFTAAKLQNLKELQEQVPGPLICGSGGGLNPDMAASQVQAFSAKHAGWWGNMMHMNNSASQGYMFEAHGGPLCASNVSSPEFEQEYAAFLMFAQRHTCTRDLLCVWSRVSFPADKASVSDHICGSWCGSDPVWPCAFDIPLGAPLGNATMAGSDPEAAVWSRRFASGTEVFFSRANTTGWVEWGPGPRQYIAEHCPH